MNNKVFRLGASAISIILSVMFEYVCIGTIAKCLRHYMSTLRTVVDTLHMLCICLRLLTRLYVMHQIAIWSYNKHRSGSSHNFLKFRDVLESVEHFSIFIRTFLKVSPRTYIYVSSNSYIRPNYWRTFKYNFTYWYQAIHTYIYVYNRRPLKKNHVDFIYVFLVPRAFGLF